MVPSPDPSKEGRHDDNIMKYAEGNKDTVIITQDSELIGRLENEKHEVIGVDKENLASMINGILEDRYEK